MYSVELLEKAANIGSKKVAIAFKTLSGMEVAVEISQAKIFPLVEALDYVQPKEEHAVVIYSQFLTARPVPGIAILSLAREHALSLVDLLNHLPVGTTGILKDIDRSALKETLNILSNSYMTALSEVTGMEIGIGVPNMITSLHLSNLVSTVLKKEETKQEAIVFETRVVIGAFNVKATLFILFNETLKEGV